MAEDKGREGSLPQSEIAKALVFRQVLEAILKHTRKTCWELTGMSKKDSTASQLTKKGGKKGDTVTGRMAGSTCLLSVVQNFVSIAPAKLINLYDNS